MVFCWSGSFEKVNESNSYTRNKNKSKFLLNLLLFN
jgi:hypothetical protein